MKSIHKNLTTDLCQFYLPSLFFLLAMPFPSIWRLSFVLFFVFVFLDIGHAYSTVLRTYLRRGEESFRPLAAPFVFFIIVFTYCYLGLPHFWGLIIYATFFHHMRQNYGLFQWYAFHDKFKNKWANLHIHLTALIPFLLFHGRIIDYGPLYHSSEHYQIDLGNLYNPLLTGYLLYFLIVTFWMVKVFSRKEISQGTLVSFLYPALLNFVCFLVFENSFQTFIPLLVFHATAYLSLINFSQKVLQKNQYSALKTWGLIILIITIFGVSEKIITDYFDIFIDSTSMKGNAFLALIISLSVLPNLMHYYLDGIIWKRSNPDFIKLISYVNKEELDTKRA